ncbi:MAG: YggS family pyridoxal phosphate-dependent enzyme [bacterium]|nr:YggS family pyridoxal phosphate-dependent enzyme [bacterium]
MPLFPARDREFLKQRLIASRGYLAQLCTEAGRSIDDVQLLPVTKAVDAQTTANLFELGEREFAENRADNLVAKAQDLTDRGMQPRWHFIGPLQRNKVRRVLRWASVLHSVHSIALLETLQRVVKEEGRDLQVYLQAHLSGDSAKQGFAPHELIEAAMLTSGSSHLQLLGVMGMGPLDDPEGLGTQRVFEGCSDLARQLESHDEVDLLDGRCRLSMGMSGDLEWAVPAGSTLVRVGSAIFR